MAMYEHHGKRFKGDDQLQEIVENTRNKSGSILFVSGTDYKIITTDEQPIKINPTSKYEVALLNLETYYSFPNINDTNNKLQFRKVKDDVWQTITIPKGCYEIKAINCIIKNHVKVIQKSTEGKETEEYPIRLTANLNTLKCALIIDEGYEVNVDIAHSIRTVLGYDAKIYGEGVHYSENSVNILQINSILVHMDIITSTYIDGKMAPIIYSFFPNASPGQKIVEKPHNLIYAPVATDVIYRMTTWLTDQDNNPIDLRGEKLTIRFHLREC